MYEIMLTSYLVKGSLPIVGEGSPQPDQPSAV